MSRRSLRQLALIAAAGVLMCGVAGLPSPVLAVHKSEATVQMEFGVKVALKGSWNEAAFRFERAVQADDTNPRAFSNLAVARENLGQFDAAREAYEKAVALDPQDRRIRENYDRFMAFLRSSGRAAAAP